MIYDSTFEGAKRIARVTSPGSIDTMSRQAFAHLQTGLEIPLRSAGAYTLSTTPWPKTANTVEKDTGFTKKKKKAKEKCNEMFGIDMEIPH